MSNREILKRALDVKKGLNLTKFKEQEAETIIPTQILMHKFIINILIGPAGANPFKKLQPSMSNCRILQKFKTQAKNALYLTLIETDGLTSTQLELQIKKIQKQSLIATEKTQTNSEKIPI